MRMPPWPPVARWTTSRPARAEARKRSLRESRSGIREGRMDLASCRVEHVGCEEAFSAARGAVEAVLDQEASQEEARFRRRHAGFRPPQLCTSVERPPAGGDWVHEIKFDGYRIQMRVENGASRLKTRKGLDWTAKFGSAISKAASELPDCLIDGEIVALDHRGSPDFAGLQAALSEGKTDDLIFFAFDLLFLEGEDLRGRSLVDRKSALEKLIEKAYDKRSGGDPICRAFRKRRRRCP